MSAKDQIKQIVDYFKREPQLKDKTNGMAEGLLLGAQLADDANERSKDAKETTLAIQEKYKEQILTQDLNPNKDPELVDIRDGSTTAGERIRKFEQETNRQLAQTEKVQKLATQIGMIEDDESAAESNYNALSSFLNAADNRVLFLNGSRFFTSQKLTLTKKGTMLIGNNRGKNLDISCLVGKFEDTILEVDIPSGKNGGVVQNISIDGMNIAKKGIVLAGNFYDSSLDTIFVDNVTDTAYDIQANNYNGRYKKISSGWGCRNGLRLSPNGNQQSEFDNCHFFADKFAGILGEGIDDQGLRVVSFNDCDFTSKNGAPLKLANIGHSVVFNNPWIEYQGTAVLNTLIIFGDNTYRSKGVVFRDGYYQGNDLVEHAFYIKNAESLTFEGSLRITAITGEEFDATNALNLVPNSFINTTIPYDPNTLIKGFKIPLFFAYCFLSNDSRLPYNQTQFFYNPDSSAAVPGNASVARSRRNSETYDRMALGESYLQFGSGQAAPDTSFIRSEANTGGMAAGDSFKVDGTWNGGHLILGVYHIWIDASRNVRIKRGIPVSDTDGSIFTINTPL